MDLILFDWNDLLSPSVLIFMIPIVAIIMGGIVAIAKLMIRHRERLAMIERGMHPDLPPGGAAPGDSGHPGQGEEED